MAKDKHGNPESAREVGETAHFKPKVVNKLKKMAKKVKPEGGMYGDVAMKRFTANKERKHKQWDKEGK